VSGILSAHNEYRRVTLPMRERRGATARINMYDRRLRRSDSKRVRQGTSRIVVHVRPPIQTRKEPTKRSEKRLYVPKFVLGRANYSVKFSVRSDMAVPGAGSKQNYRRSMARIGYAAFDGLAVGCLSFQP
jgi:hypothetical protein